MGSAEPEGTHERTNRSDRSSAGGRRLGELLVKEGLITQGQLEEALRIHGTLEPYTPVGQVLVGQKVITIAQLNTVLDRYGKRPPLGRILVAAKAITESQLQAALTYQRKTNLRLGDALLQLDLTEQEIKQAVSIQLNIPFVRLEDFTPDPGLAQLIRKPYAEKHRVIPIAKLGSSVTVAMDDPTDLAVVEELQRLTGCAVNVVTCTRRGFLRALAKAYADAEARTNPLAEARQPLRKDLT